MLYSDVYGRLILLTRRNDITHAEIGSCINLERGAVFARAKRNSKMKPEEVSKIEKHFGVNLKDADICLQIDKNNSSNLINSGISFSEQASNFGMRLNELQNKSQLSDTEFAKLLGLYTNEYKELKNGIRKPNIEILDAVKKNFKISIDSLLYGA